MTSDRVMVSFAFFAMTMSLLLFHRDTESGINHAFKQMVSEIDAAGGRFDRVDDYGRPDLKEQISSRPWLYGLPININIADANSLMDLPGIGNSISQRIIVHREVHGDFVDFTDLDNVKGIGPRTIKKVSGHIRFK